VIFVGKRPALVAGWDARDERRQKQETRQNDGGENTVFMAMMRAIVAATRRGVKQAYSQAYSRHRDARLAFVGCCGKLAALRRPWLQPALNARVVLALVAGLALALAFPKPGWAGLAWVAPALMFLAGLGTSPKRAFRLGYLSGLTGNLIALTGCCSFRFLSVPWPRGLP